MGDILNVAFQIYSKNAQKLIVIVAVVVLPLNFIAQFIGGVVFPGKKETVILFGHASTETVRTGAQGFIFLLITLAIAIVIVSALQAALLRAGALAALGDPIDVEASYRFGLKRFGPVLGAAILVGLISVLGLFLVIVGAIFFFTMLSVTIPALVVEGSGVTDSMSRSWNLVKGNFWHALGTVALAFLIVWIVSGIITAIGGHNWFLRWIFGSIGQIITQPFSALASVLLYLDLRARTEALTASAFRAQLSRSA